MGMFFLNNFLQGFLEILFYSEGEYAGCTGEGNIQKCDANRFFKQKILYLLYVYMNMISHMQ
jgi:hypothetical protein